jgi:hypothetical protein
MKREVAELIVEHGYDMEIYEDYSGRGMFGDTTTGVVCDSLRDFLAAVSEKFYEMILDAKDLGEDYDTEDAKVLMENVGRIRLDNLGTSLIIY